MLSQVQLRSDVGYLLGPSLSIEQYLPARENQQRAIEPVLHILGIRGIILNVLELCAGEETSYW